MKKHFIALIIFCLTIIFPSTVSAVSDDTYSLDVNGANMTIEMPAGWDVFTRDLSSSQADLKKYGLFANEFLQTLESQDIYIDAIDPETSNEILVFLTEDYDSTQVFNLSTSSDKFLDSIVEETKNDTSNTDLSLVDWKNVEDYKYLYYEYGTPVYWVQYSTIVNGQYVKIALQNPVATYLNTNDINLLNNTIKSISFSNITAPEMDTIQSVLQDSVNITALFVTLAIGLIVAILLLLLLFKNKNKTLTVTQQEYNKINHIGGFLAFMAVRIIIGIIIGIVSLSSMLPGTYLLCYFILIILCIVNLPLLFLKNRYFIAAYILMNIYSVIFLAAFNNYSGLIALVIIESFFILYLFKSKRVAIVYKTKKISIIDSQIQCNGISSDTTAISLEKLKKVNPLAYKRNVVGLAAGFRDFSGMIAAHPDLDNNLAFAASTEDLDKIATAYGFVSFEEMFRFSEQILENKKGKQQ